MLVAVQQRGSNLYYAPLWAQDDVIIVRAAVAQFGYSIEHASARLKNDKDIALQAVSSCCWQAANLSRAQWRSKRQNLRIDCPTVVGKRWRLRLGGSKLQEVVCKLDLPWLAHEVRWCAEARVGGLAR